MHNLPELFQQIVLHTDRRGKRTDIDGSSLEMRLSKGETSSTAYLKIYPSGFYEQVVKVWSSSDLVFQGRNVTRTPALIPEEKFLAISKYLQGAWEDDFLKTKLKPPYA